MSDFNPLLCIMNPRQIPECIESFEALTTRRAWLQNYTEWQLQDVINSIVADQTIHFSHMILCADDCIVTQQALDAVLEYAPSHPVVTGYCRLDFSHPEVNLCRSPLRGDVSTVGAYDFYRYDVVSHWHEPIVPTHFVGFSLTCMSREMWSTYPFGVFGGPTRSFASDFHLSRRLRDAGVPMVAAREGYITHVKERWNTLDVGAGRQLLVGHAPAGVRVEE